MKNKFKLPNKFNKNTLKNTPVYVGDVSNPVTYKHATAQEIEDARRTLRTHTDPAFRKAADHFRDGAVSEMIYNARHWSSILDQTMAVNQGYDTKMLLDIWVRAQFTECDTNAFKTMFFLCTALIGKGTYEVASQYFGAVPA